MAKLRQHVVTFDEVRQIDIRWLRELGFLRPGRRVTGGTLSWRNGSSLKVDVDARASGGRVTLFSAVGDDRGYSVGLEGFQSNLGKGLVWFFICPDTNRRCRKLYDIGGRFISRYACPSGLYRSQAEAKRDRSLRKYITLNGTAINPKEEWDYSDPQRFRQLYNGRLTKRYRDYLKRTEKTKDLLGNAEWLKGRD